MAFGSVASHRHADMWQVSCVSRFLMSTIILVLYDSSLNIRHEILGHGCHKLTTINISHSRLRLG